MNGEAELGFGTISEILARPSLEMVAPMPPELQSSITFVSVLPMNAREPAAAKELVVFLASPEAHIVLRRSGLEPDQP